MQILLRFIPPVLWAERKLLTVQKSFKESQKRTDQAHGHNGLEACH